MTHILSFLIVAASDLERRYASPVTPASTSLAKRSGILSSLYNLFNSFFIFHLIKDIVLFGLRVNAPYKARLTKQITKKINGM